MTSSRICLFLCGFEPNLPPCRLAWLLANKLNDSSLMLRFVQFRNLTSRDPFALAKVLQAVLQSKEMQGLKETPEGTEEMQGPQVKHFSLL